MKGTFSLNKIAGIGIYIHWTFIILILWIIYSNAKAGLDAMQIGWSVLFILSMFVCVTLHELGHALAAKRYGIVTKDITLYPIGGVARLEKMPENPKHELVVALAGPLVNVIIMVVLLPIILNYDFEKTPDEAVLVITRGNFLPMLGILNIWLAVFNLIPAFPMDGGRVLRALLSFKTNRVRATRIAAQIGQLLAIGFVFIGFYTNPFLIFIGLFIILGAQSELEMVKTQSFLTDLKAGDAIMTHYQSIDKNQTIADSIKILLDGEAKNFLITENGYPFGVINRDHIIKGIQDFGENAPLHAITDTGLIIVDINDSLNLVFQEFQKTRSPLILVHKNNQLAGIIDAENIAELIMIKNARQIKA